MAFRRVELTFTIKVSANYSDILRLNETSKGESTEARTVEGLGLGLWVCSYAPLHREVREDGKRIMSHWEMSRAQQQRFVVDPSIRVS